MGGGGMGGGGMFSVPAEILPQVPVQGFVAFAVKEDAPAADAPAKAKAAARPRPTRRRPRSKPRLPGRRRSR